MAQAPSATPGTAGSGAEPDPSMDDILASIRRILDDDDKAAKASPDGVLMLDPSMIVEEEPGASQAVGEAEGVPTASELVRASGGAGAHPEWPDSEGPALATPDETVHSDLVIDDMPSSSPSSVPREAQAPAASMAPAAATLVAPAAAAAAATSVDALMRTLAAERSAAVSRGMVTIEDVVREEIRPLLKLWLDSHLPPLVERLVQAEIERVIGRNPG